MSIFNPALAKRIPRLTRRYSLNVTGQDGMRFNEW